MNFRSDARASAAEVETALNLVVDRVLADGPVDTFDNETIPRDRLLVAHDELLVAFVSVLGGTTASKARACHPNIKVDIQMLGFSDIDPATGERDQDAGRLRFEVGRETGALGGPNVDLDDRRFIAHIWYIWLPPELQRHGYGHQLVLAFMRLWTAMGVELVAATAVRDASRAAFRRWGFACAGTDGNGEPMFSYLLI